MKALVLSKPQQNTTNNEHLQVEEICSKTNVHIFSYLQKTILLLIFKNSPMHLHRLSTQEK
jgi:hypothetical protein